MKKGKFIVFEGIDGSGTSTQANLLNEYLNNIDTKSILTTEPSSGPIGNLIREAFKGRVIFSKSSKVFDKQMSYLFAADRLDHLENPIDGIRVLQDKNINVISTRYFYSSLAYHTSNEIEYQEVKNLNKDFPLPDLTIYLNGNIDKSIERISKRPFKDIYETRNKLEKVQNNYKKILKDYPDNLLIIDGNLSISEIHYIIVENVMKLLKKD